jgi:hypothetical protein
MMNTAIEQQPLVKAAQATELARRRTGIDAVGAQMLEKCRHVGLESRNQDRVAPFKQFGEDAQIAEVGLARERAKSFFDTEIGGIAA